MPNSWRIDISCMVIWMIIVDDDMITLNELVQLYCLKESKEFSCYELVSWDRRSRLIADLPHPSIIGSLGTSLCQVTVGRLSLTTSGGMSLGCCVGGRPLYLVRLLCIFLFFVRLLAWTVRPDLCVFVVVVFYLFIFTIKDRLELESRFAERVRAAIEYVSTIDDLVDPKTLARHCLGPEPSHYVLHAICHEEKSKFL